MTAPRLAFLSLLLTAAPLLAQGTGAKKALTAAPPAAPAKPQDPAPAALMQARGPTRIDFDDRLVQGQTNKLGAVYLYQRRAPAQPSLLVRRSTFRDEIARDLLE